DDNVQNTIAFARYDEHGTPLVALINFSAVTRSSYRFGVPIEGTYRELLNSDSSAFGGSGVCNEQPIASESIPMHGFLQSIELCVPPLAAVYLQCEPAKPAVRPKLLRTAKKAVKK
ncbi:MAG: alpha amylase C-terminal domain-containing protein, partial [Oscillospiraceae bacterium]